MNHLAFDRFDLSDVDDSISLLIDSLDLSQIGPISLGITRKQYFTLYGIWLINLLGLIVRFTNDVSCSEYLYVHKHNSNQNFSLTYEDDYKYCIYLARFYGDYISSELLLSDLKSIIGHELNRIDDDRQTNISKRILLADNIILTFDLLDFISLKLSPSPTPKLKSYQYSTLCDLVESVIPRSLTSPNFSIEKYVSFAPKSTIAYMYGDSFTENCLACIQPMTIKQHGIQEQLIYYNPQQFYLNRSLFNYLPYNSFIANCNKKFINLRILKRAIFTCFSTFSSIGRLHRTVTIFTSSTNPNQNLIGDKNVAVKYWQDIFEISRNLSDTCSVIIRPTQLCKKRFHDQLLKLETIPGLIVDWDRVLKPSLFSIVIATSFTTYILESSLSLQQLYIYLPSYRPNSRLNDAGKMFFDSSKLSDITYSTVSSLMVHLKSVLNNPFYFLLLQIRLKICLVFTILF